MKHVAVHHLRGVIHYVRPSFQLVHHLRGVIHHVRPGFQLIPKGFEALYGKQTIAPD